MKFNHNTAKVVAAFFCIAAMPQLSSADDYSGEKTLGVEAGYTTKNKSGMAGIEFTYRFSKHFRLAPSVNYVFRHNKQDALLLNVNAHVPVPLSGKWEFYPLAGINYSSWSFHNGKTANDDADVTSRVSRFGLNVGAGFGLNISSTLRLDLSADYVIIKEFGGCNILAKISYQF